MEPRDHALSEAISFKLFDGQSLQYDDRIPDGFYDIWGNFVGVADNTPVSNFPTLEELLRIPYIVGEEREVILVDRRNDARLRELEAQAATIIKRNERASALTCVKELAVFVADCMGGACSHETLSQQYQLASRKMKQELNSLVLPLGELPLGLSRHRALMLKVLADNCGLPCRLVRGDFYLGSAGHSGENSIALLQFDGQEWMLELVTEPGKLHRVRKDPVREQQAARWNARISTSMERCATPLHRQGFPTLPGAEKERRENSSSSDPSSGAQKEGLQWSDLDGPTMEELESEAQSHPSDSSSLEPSTASQTKAKADEQLQGLNQRLSAQRSLTLSQDFSAETSRAQTAELSRAPTADSLEASQQSFAEEQQDRDSTESQEKWLPYDGSAQQGMQLSVEGVQEVRTGKFGSSHGTGPARARVRGRDARGRLVELELQGLTVTHAHNLSLGNRSLDALRRLPQARHSEDHASRSLESMIGRYRYLPGGGQSQSRASGSSEEGRAHEHSSLPVTGNHLEVRQFLRGKLPAHSDSERQRGKAWERQMRERYSSDTKSSGSGRLSEDRLPPPSASREEQSRDSELDCRVSLPPAIDPEAAQMRLHSLLHNPTIARQLSGEQKGAIAAPLGAATTKAPPAVVQHATAQETKPDQAAAAAALVPPDSSLSEATTSTIDDDVLAVEAAEDIEVPFEEIELGPRIGVGCFGEVFKARWRQTTVAVKRLFAQTLSENNIKEFRAEVLMNRRLKHPNVIMFMGACTKPPNLSIITQWAPKGSLYHLLHNTRCPELTLRQRLRMALDIARGMHYLHSARPPVIHRDLKSMNLLVDNDLSIKDQEVDVDDRDQPGRNARMVSRLFERSFLPRHPRGLLPDVETQDCTPTIASWTAPEVLRNAQYNEKSDVYSYGVVLFELATGEEPWSDMHSMQVVGAVGWAGKRLEPPEGCPPIFANLMRRCFQEAEKRPSFETIIGDLLRFANETRPQSARSDSSSGGRSR